MLRYSGLLKFHDNFGSSSKLLSKSPIYWSQALFHTKTLQKMCRWIWAQRAVADPRKFFFLCFPIFPVQFECFITYRKKINDCKMIQLSSEKQRNSLLAERKSFIGSATGEALKLRRSSLSSVLLFRDVNEEC